MGVMAYSHCARQGTDTGMGLGRGRTDFNILCRTVHTAPRQEHG